MAVLGAAGVNYDVQSGETPGCIVVATEGRALAMEQLLEYEEECLYWPPKIDFAYPGVAGMNLPSFYAGIFLLCFFFVTGSYDADVTWFKQGRGDTEKILSGEVWRAITALTLHSDFAHVAGNVIGCVFLCGAVCQYLGNGIGWLVILLSAVTANLLNTVIGRPAYNYIGASTAVFAAVGILGALQSVRLYRNFRVYTHRLSLPLLSVLAIISLLGTGPKADIMGHFMGAICGIIFGFVCSHLRTYRERRVLQFCCLMIAAGTILLSWRFALHLATG